MATGVPATASIVSATPTGESIKKEPVVKFVLRLTIPGHPPYQVVHEQAVPPGVPPTALQPGAVLDVRSQRDDPLDVMIVFGGQEQNRPMVNP